MNCEDTERAKQKVEEANREMESAKEKENLIKFAVRTIERLRNPGANNVLLKTEFIRQVVAAGMITFEKLTELEDDPEETAVTAELLDRFDREECDELARFYKRELVRQAPYMDDPYKILRTIEFYNKKGNGKIQPEELKALEKSVYDYKVIMAETKLKKNVVFEDYGFEDLRNAGIMDLFVFMEMNGIQEDEMSKTKREILFEYYHD